MRVHRDNDVQSGDEQPGKASRPHLDAPNPSDGTSPSDGTIPSDGSVTPLPASLDTPAPADDGKTHMIGDALKSVYQRTLEEDIPDDFLDLLKQLK